MASNSRSVKVSIIGDASSLKRATAEADASVAKLTGSLDKASKSSDAMGAKGGAGLSKMNVALAAGATAAVAFGVKSVNAFEQAGMEVLKLQRYTGGTAEDMSKLRFAASQTGTDVDMLGANMGRLSKNLEKSKDPMADFGIVTKDATGHARPLNDIILDLADKFQKMPAGTERTALAMKLFGKSGADMLPFLARGKDGIKALMDQTEEYGQVLSQEQVQAAKDAVEAHRKLDAAVQGLEIRIGQGLLPVVEGATKALTALPGPLGDSAVTIGALAIGAAALRGPLGAIGGWVSNAATSFSNWATSAGKVGPAMNEAIKGEEQVGAQSVSMGAKLGIAAAAFVAVQLYAKNYADSLAEARQQGEEISKGLEEQLNNTSGVTGSYQRLTGAYNEAKATYEGYMAKVDETNPLLVRERNSYTEWANAAANTGNKLAPLIGQVDALSKSTGKNKDEVAAWLLQQQDAGITYDSNEKALAAYTDTQGKVGSSADQAKAAEKAFTDELKHQDDQLKRLQDSYDAAMDARFALASGTLDVRSADRDVRAAQRELAQVRKDTPKDVDAIQAAEDRLEATVIRRANAQVEQADRVKMAVSGQHLDNDEKLKIYNGEIDTTLQKYGLWGLKADELKVKADGIVQSLKDAQSELANSAFDKLLDPNSQFHKSVDSLSGETAGGMPTWLPGFASGGMVGGPRGAPRLAVVHGGERVMTPEQQMNVTFNNSISGMTAAEVMAVQMAQERRAYAMAG